MKIPLLILLLTGIPPLVLSASDFEGCVVHAQTKEPIAGAVLWLKQENRHVVTDSLGRFHFTNITPTETQVIITAAGFRPFVQKISIPGNFHFMLEPLLVELDQVVVTAVASHTSIRKTPVAIAAVSQKEYTRTTGTNAIDAVLRNVPGMTAITTGPNISKPFIRGLGYNRVLTLYDGLRQEGQQWGDEHGIEVDPYGIAKAEVVKGPASLFYGSDAIAGVVNLIPGLPSETGGQIRGETAAEYQTNNQLKGFSSGIYYRKKSIGFSARGSVRHAIDYTNAADGRVYNTGFSEKNASLMLGWEKNQNRQFLHFTLYDNLQEIPDGSRDSLTRAFTRQVFESDKDDIRNRPLVTHEQLSASQVGELHQHIQHYRLYHKSQFTIKQGELSTLLGIQQNIRREYNHPAAPLQAGLFVSLLTLNYELKYRFPEIAGIAVTYGMNGMYQQNKNKDATDFPIPDYNLLDMGHFIMARKETGRSVISGGLRWDNRVINWNDFYLKKDPVSGFNRQVAVPDTAGSSLQFAAFHQRFQGISGSIGWVYNYSDAVTLKANFATGYRCPSIPEIGSGGLDPGAHIYYIGNRSFVPETNWQADLGILITNPDYDAGADLFYNRINHYIYLRKLYNANGQPLEIIPGNFTYQYQQGGAAIYGAEYHVNIHPARIPWLTVHHELSAINGINTDAASLKLLGEEAKYLPLIPPLRTMNRVRVQWPGKNNRITDKYLQGEWETYATQNRFYAVDNTETVTMNYALLNMSAGFSIRNKKNKTVCQLVVSINNLFNKAYQAHQNRLKYFEYYSSSPTGFSGIYNMGRNCVIKWIVNW